MEVNIAHWHLLLNHFPIIGMIIGFCLLVVALIQANDDLKKASLGIIACVGLITIPAYMTGIGAEQALLRTPGITQAMINRHEGAAMLGLWMMIVTGGAAFLALWKFRG